MKRCDRRATERKRAVTRQAKKAGGGLDDKVLMQHIHMFKEHL